MNLYVSDFLNDRIDEITQDLLRTNGEYALAVEKSKKLMENINPIIHCKREIVICASDCIDFKEFLECEGSSAAILREELYKQGFLDCVELLKGIGIA